MAIRCNEVDIYRVVVYDFDNTTIHTIQGFTRLSLPSHRMIQHYTDLGHRVEVYNHLSWLDRRSNS